MADGSWTRVTKSEPCAVCGKGDWCVRSIEEEGVAICMRVSEGSCRTVECGGAGTGYLHGAHKGTRGYRVHASSRPRLDELVPDWAEAVRRRAQRTSTVDLHRHASALGVSTRSLVRLGAYVEAEHMNSTCFPMRRSSGRVVGVRIRRLRPRAGAPRYLCVRGSKTALFLPKPRSAADPLLLPEGPTDTCALLDLGYDAVGRPSATSGARDLSHLARGRDVVVLSENDEKPDGRRPGTEGAERVARALAGIAARIRIASPPPEFKDVRDWIAAGAGRAELDSQIDDSPAVRVRLRRAT